MLYSTASLIKFDHPKGPLFCHRWHYVLIGMLGLLNSFQTNAWVTTAWDLILRIQVRFRCHMGWPAMGGSKIGTYEGNTRQHFPDAILTVEWPPNMWQFSSMISLSSLKQIQIKSKFHWAVFWQYVQKFFGCANPQFHQLSGWLVSDDPAGEEDGCKGPGRVRLHVVCGWEACWTYCQIF